MKNKRKKILIVLILMCMTSTLLGFTSFSNTITLASNNKSSAFNSTFKIVFSNKIDSIDTSEVKPVLEPTSITADNGVINNASRAVISNLNVNFTGPGQKAIYNFYVYNAGRSSAHLKSIIYNNALGYDEFKVCNAKEEISQELVDAACKDIKITVKIGSLTTTTTKTEIENSSLNKDVGEPIQIIIEYIDNGNRADGPFEIIFGDISLYYESI